MEFSFVCPIAVTAMRIPGRANCNHPAPPYGTRGEEGPPGHAGAWNSDRISADHNCLSLTYFFSLGLNSTPSLSLPKPDFMSISAYSRAPIST